MHSEGFEDYFFFFTLMACRVCVCIIPQHHGSIERGIITQHGFDVVIKLYGVIEGVTSVPVAQNTGVVEAIIICLIIQVVTPSITQFLYEVIYSWREDGGRYIII